jgi:hypothetical protein
VAVYGPTTAPGHGMPQNGKMRYRSTMKAILQFTL